MGDIFGIGVAIRYIYSNLAAGQDVNGVPIKAGNAVGADIGFHFTKDITIKETMEGNISVGTAITNLGSKISYTENAENQDFIPTNWGLGVGFSLKPNEYNSIALFFDINRLLVPTPDTIDSDGNGIFDYRELSSIKGLFTSFADAPGGAKEELREFNFSAGFEYWYNGQFAVRAGYFWEHATKGNRKFFTAGIGVKYSVFGLNFSYLVPTSNERNPLDNTLRFSLLFDFDKVGRDKKEEVIPEPISKYFN